MPPKSTLIIRGSVLFFLGASFFIVCEALHGAKAEFSSYNIESLNYFSNLWLPVACGIASGKLITIDIIDLVAVGLLSPCLDFKLGLFDVYNNEWSSVLRCVALFFGFGHATGRIEFATYFQLLFTIIGLSIGLWLVFDGSRVGLGFGIAVALVATFISQSVFYKRISEFTYSTVMGWLPCLFFSGGIVIVLVGRQLAKPDIIDVLNKKLK